jgi:hypothetical protein
VPEDYDEQGNLINNEEDGEPIVKKKKISSLANKRGILDERFKGIDPSTVEKISDSFKDREFCVMIEMGNETYSKKQLERGVTELAGEFVQNPTSNTHCIVASKITHKLQGYIQKDLYDIVNPKWLDQCIKEKSYIDWKPSDMWHTKATTKLQIGKLYDCFGDSFTEETTIESLKEIFKGIDSTSEIDKSEKDTNSEQVTQIIAYFENRYFPNESFRFGLFRLLNVYLDVFESVGGSEKRLIKYSNLDLIGLKVKWLGGTIHEKIKDETTHCILDKNELIRLSQMKKINRSRDKKIHIISSDWIDVCVKSNRMVNELQFHL